MRLLLIPLFLFIAVFTSGQIITINEVMSSNYNTIQDEDGDTPDWLELYNSSQQPLNLAGYSLSDKKEELRKWIFPNIEIGAGEILIIFVSGKDRPASFDLLSSKNNSQNVLKSSSHSNLHTNFRIDSNGEVLLLSDKNGVLIDSLFTGIIPTDISRGRFPDGANNWFYFENPSPGLPNDKIGCSSVAKSPTFSIPPGNYTSTITLSLSTSTEEGKIYYTTDGSIPTESSSIYSRPLILSATTVVRARTFCTNYLPSETITKTYFLNTAHKIPTISLVTDQSNFFDYHSGIYVKGPNAENQNPYFGANFWENWERPIHIEFFEADGDLGFNFDGGVKIYGAWSRAFPQKSLALFARGINGYNEVSYPIFPNNQIQEFQSFVLRNSGNDWEYSMFRDALMQAIVDPLDIDKLAYQPTVLYFNGEYWGIHNLREKISTNYLASYYDLDPDDINLLENGGGVVDGVNDSYFQFLTSIESMDMRSAASFDFVNSKIDLNNFIDYQIAQIFFDNRDWPGNNIKYWQRKSTNSKWRWILYDTDFGFGIYDSQAYKRNTLEFATEPYGPGWPNPPWSTFLLRRFLENEQIKNRFISRFSVYLNTIFNAENINNIITRIINEISSEMPQHYDRWNLSYSRWLSQITLIRNFANNRASHCLVHVYQYFDLEGQIRLYLNSDTTKGFIEVEDLPFRENEWDGFFFKDIPLKLKAKAKKGFRFSHWEGDLYSEEAELRLPNNEDINLTAVFIPYISDNCIVINEVNYNSNIIVDCDDWVELYNNSDNDIDISDWIFKDQNDIHSFTFPEGSIIERNNYLVICRDTSKFKNFFPQVNNIIGDLDFGLSNGGELIRVFDSNNNLVDSLTYDDQLPWPVEPDGNGPTLSLLNYTRDNTKPENWSASAENGTPGSINDVFTSSEEITNKISEYKLFQNYPNPFNPTTIIEYQIPQDSKVILELYTVTGERVSQIIDKEQKAGFYSYPLDTKQFNLSSGVYLYRFSAISGTHKNFISTKKLILLK